MKKKLLVAALAAFAAGPMATLTAETPSTVKGQVLETIDVGQYTYLRLKTADGEIWAAVNQVPVKVGGEVTIHDAMEMQDFESKALKRTFPSIVFGVVGEDAPASAQAPAAMPPGHPGVSGSTSAMPVGHPNVSGSTAAMPPGHPGMPQGHGAAAAPENIAEDVKVTKADGPVAHTIGEIYAARADLKDSTVVVRAKVVKVTANVMGRTWVHLRDGSGAASDGSNDMLVTSSAEPSVGDVVVAKGVVRTDVDLGYGYAYKVMVEDASFQK